MIFLSQRNNHEVVGDMIQFIALSVQSKGSHEALDNPGNLRIASWVWNAPQANGVLNHCHTGTAVGCHVVLGAAVPSSSLNLG
jgi:hypothetical protein